MHSSLSTARKLSVYRASVITKLLYGLRIYVLRKVECNRIDAFHARCLRQILGVPHSMISHVPNTEVLEQAADSPLSRQLLREQLILFGRIASLTDESVLRNTIFQNGSCHPKLFEGVHRRGRPRNTWIGSVSTRALQIAGGQNNLTTVLSGPAAVQNWKRSVKQYL